LARDIDNIRVDFSLSPGLAFGTVLYPELLKECPLKSGTKPPAKTFAVPPDDGRRCEPKSATSSNPTTAFSTQLRKACRKREGAGEAFWRPKPAVVAEGKVLQQQVLSGAKNADYNSISQPRTYLNQ
jgi:hypothetical protein